MFSPFDVILPEDGERRVGVAARRNFVALNATAVGLEVFLPTTEVATGAENGFAVIPASIEEQGLEGGYVVKQSADAHDVRQFALVEIFVEHSEVVAEVEIGFPCIAFG